MKAIDQYLSEAVNTIFYHGSSTQNLKELTIQKRSSRNKSDSPRIYVSDNLIYASAFTWDWRDSDGVDLGRYNNDPYFIKIPKRLKSKTTGKPCSIYIVSGSTIKKVTNQESEYVSFKSLTIKKEMKYKNALEAMTKSGLIVEWI